MQKHALLFVIFSATVPFLIGIFNLTFSTPYAKKYVPDEIELEQHFIPEDVLKHEKGRVAGVNTYSFFGEIAKKQSMSIRVPILLYHYIEYVQDKKDTIRISLNITPFIFESQLKTLVDNGYTFITAYQLADMLDGLIPVPQKPVLLTFDDGYRDFYTDAFPLLKKYNAKATAYIVPGFLNMPNYMYTSQLKEIVQNGLVEIGAHTVHHAYLKGIRLQDVISEVVKSKTMLENMFHVYVVSFAYPYGAFDQQAIDVVRNAGFRTAVSTVPGIIQSQTNRFYLFRIRPGGRTGMTLLNWLNTID